MITRDEDGNDRDPFDPMTYLDFDDPLDEAFKALEQDVAEREKKPTVTEHPIRSIYRTPKLTPASAFLRYLGVWREASGYRMIAQYVGSADEYQFLIESCSPQGRYRKVVTVQRVPDWVPPELALTTMVDSLLHGVRDGTAHGEKVARAVRAIIANTNR